MRAVLFDVDGVLLDTGALFADIWRDWALRHGLDPATVLVETYGRRSADTLRSVAPHLDPDRERAALDHAVLARIGQVRPVDGAAALLRTLPAVPWAIATSGSEWFVRRCMSAAGLPPPPVAVFDEDVQRGKPAPDGYLLAARRLGVAPEDCVVVEDAPHGVAAARAAGCRVVAVTTTHRPVQLSQADACRSTLAEVGVLLANLATAQPATASATAKPATATASATAAQSRQQPT
ncbi:HAD-IA family hydrolase [Solwaraspora sp. WMMD406]|uniref:HAD family hydrolase n=1 Tax=Solwaraspora sp. WMMD406 TaxID=3016095 RepID=UPI002416348C|nr:HAD-IA family hydrolase [Solwaraspora sp. WMMD406]MDG4765742.1 HAD-IA family hydrolase [Solwaraspora sp. WMMD406]